MIRHVLPLAGALLLLSSGNLARADIIPTVVSVSPHGSNFTWTYDAAMTSDENLKSGNFFTIYDFDGYVSGTNFQPSHWVFSSALVGKTPPKVVPDDNPLIPNLTWTYSGPKTGPGPVDLGHFGADSTLGMVKTGEFASEATKHAPGMPTNGKPVDNIGFTGVPGIIPETSALLLLLPGLAPLGLWALSREHSSRRADRKVLPIDSDSGSSRQA
jgi:hypothetical protein